MNSVLLLMATLAVTTAADYLPISLASTEPNQVGVLRTNQTSTSVCMYYDVYCCVDATVNDDDDIFNDDDVIEYSTTQQPDNSDPPENFDFYMWDMTNEANKTFLAEFNQTILNEMKQNKIQQIIPESIPTTTRPQREVRVTQKGCARCSRCARARKQTHSPAQNAVRNMSTCTSKHNTDGDAKENGYTRCSKCVRARRLTSSVQARRAVCKLKKRPARLENDIHHEDLLRSNMPVTPPNETKKFNEETDETDHIYDEYDSEILQDPCNYEKLEHPLPTIEKIGRRVSDIKCDEYMWRYKIEILDVDKNRKKCAKQMAKNKEQGSKVAGGFAAVQGDFPHMGAVGWIEMNGNKKWICGSSLISPRFTLTAAHCRRAPLKLLGLKYREPKVVRFGSVFLKDKTNDIKKIITVDVKIEKFLVVEEYARAPAKKYNDIGLIKLKWEVEMKLFIKPACLWNGFLGKRWVANITGWGQTTRFQGSESSHLRYAELDFVGPTECKRYIHSRKNRNWFEGLKNHQFCAGKLEGGIDSCPGDSGGPLQIRDHWVPVTEEHLPVYDSVVHHVVGVTSFGIECAHPRMPGVYTNIISFLCWIEKNVWPEENNAFCH